jgi:hypothetical protein
VDSPTPGSQLKSSITDATRKIESIIDDAERAADDIRAEASEEAERESRRRISESASQLAAVVDPLIKRVENLRVEAAGLMHELETATLELVELTKRSTEQAAADTATIPAKPEPPTPAAPSTPEPVEASPPAPISGPAPVAYPGTGAPAAKGLTGDPPEEAVLRATQMAVAGNSRSEIEETLRDEFNLTDAAPVVEDILGPA